MDNNSHIDIIHQFNQKIDSLKRENTLLMEQLNSKQFNNEIFSMDYEFICDKLEAPIILISNISGGHIMYCNEAWTRITGYSKSESLKLAPVSVIVEEDRYLIEKIRDKRMIGDYSNLSAEVRIRTKSGDLKWAGFLSSVVNINGKLRSLIHAQDITNEKSKANDLARSEKIFKALFEDSLIINLILNRADFVIADANLEAINYFGYLKDDFLGKPICELFFECEKSVEQLNNLINEGGGTTEFQFRLKNGMVRLTEVNVSRISVYDDTLFLISLRDITERKSLEAALIESEAKYKAIVDNNYDGIYIYKGNSIIFANNRLFQLSGYSPQDFNSREFWEIVHPEDRERIKQYAVERAKGLSTQNNYQGRVICKDGVIKECEFSVTAIKLFNDYAVLGVVRDISERIKSERIIKESEEKFRNFAMNSPVGIFSTNQDGVCTFVNPQWLRLLNKSEEEVVGKKWTHAIAEPDQKLLIDKFEDHIKENDSYASEFKVNRSDNQVIWVYGKITKIKGSGGVISSYLGSFVNITERKVADEKLKESERFLSTLIGNLKGVVYRCMLDEDWTMLYFSDAVLDLTGYSKDELLENKSITYIEIIHPDDRDMVKSIVMNSLQNNTLFSLEYRIIRKDGTMKWVWEQGAKIVTDDGSEFVEGNISDITSQKNAEDRLKKSEERYRYITENSIDIVWQVDKELRFSYVSPALVKILGYTPEEWVGKPIWFLINKRDLISITQKVLDQYSESDLTPVVKIETAIKHKISGEYVTLETEGKLFYENNKLVGLIGTSRNVTERNGMIAKIKENAANYMAIFGNTGTATCITNSIGDIILVNKKFEELSGTHSKNIIGRLTLVNFLSGVDQINKRVLDDLAESQSESVFKDVKGIKKSIILSVQEIERSNKYVISILDITKNKAVENELKKLNEELESRVSKRTDQLSSANRSKSEFLANMSHEIRTPINAILGFTELLSNKVSNPVELKYLNSILVSGKNLLSLINDTLDLSKIEAGKLDLTLEPSNVISILEDIKKIFELKSEKKGLILDLEVKNNLSDQSYTFIVDENRLKQVLINLVNNAIKFTDSGYVKMKLLIEPEKKDSNSRYEFANITIQVEDTGIGISKEFLKKIFDPFTKLHSSFENNYDGTGLGLSISLKLVKLMNGELTVHSTLGKGSQFSVFLKHVSIAETEKFYEQTYRFNVKDVVFQKRTILIVDDVPLNIDYLYNVLTQYSLDVLVARNGQEALDVLMDNKVDLIITDLKMPVKDGFLLQQELQKSEDYCHIPIIAATALANKDSLLKIEAHKFSAHLFKPYSVRDITKMLLKFIPYSGVEVNCKTAQTENQVQPLLFEEDLVKQFRQILIPMWKKIESRQSHVEVIEFGKELESVGIETDRVRLEEMGRNIVESMEQFDISQVISFLKNFKEILKENNLLT